MEWIIALTLILFLIIFVCAKIQKGKKRVNNPRSDSNCSVQNSSDSISSEADSKTTEVQKQDECRIKDETVSFKAITDSQREALLAANPKTRRTKSLTGIVIKVVGAAYRTPAAKAIYSSLNIGDPVYLKLDPDNVYDDTAVKVMAKYNCIGYVPDEYSNAIYAYMGMDKFDQCYVVEPSSGASLQGLQIVIFLKPDNDKASH